MQFKTLLKESEKDSSERNENFVDLLYSVINQGSLEWNSKVTTEMFLLALGINKRDLDKNIKALEFNKDLITLVYSGRADEFVHIGKEPIKFLAPNLSEGQKVSVLSKKEIQELFEKWFTKDKGNKDKVFKEFKKMDLAQIAKDLK